MQVVSSVRREAPSLSESGAAATTAFLLIFSFPNYELFFLAWIALVPLLLVIVRQPSPLKAFMLGWATGTVFFYGTCYWLTYSMIHYGGLPTILAYLLLIPGALVVGIFPGLFACLMALAIRRWGYFALLLAPIFWPALEWLRLSVTGQLWNALGYSQAFHPSLITAAKWGGVYAVSFLIVTINSAIALLVVRRNQKTVTAAIAMIFLVWCSLPLSEYFSLAARTTIPRSDIPPLTVIAVQPNVPMTLVKTPAELEELRQRHFALSTKALNTTTTSYDKLTIWPESPMNFTYASDKSLQDLLARFSKDNHTALLLNSLEPAPKDGSYNSALLINEDGRLISQYDKIRLMPFGEYVPLPHWLPGASLISGLVGEFTPGTEYRLMPVGSHGYRAGVFICIESAYPWIARTMTNEGADFLINISNDGYLGPTAVMRQHLANAIFRAVENDRPVVRVTNSGLSTLINPNGVVMDQTKPFETDVRVWTVTPVTETITSYTIYGDLFVEFCTAVTAIALLMLSGEFLLGNLRWILYRFRN